MKWQETADNRLRVANHHAKYDEEQDSFFVAILTFLLFLKRYYIIEAAVTCSYFKHETYQV